MYAQEFRKLILAFKKKVEDEVISNNGKGAEISFIRKEAGIIEYDKEGIPKRMDSPLSVVYASEIVCGDGFYLTCYTSDTDIHLMEYDDSYGMSVEEWIPFTRVKVISEYVIEFYDKEMGWKTRVSTYGLEPNRPYTAW